MKPKTVLDLFPKRIIDPKAMTVEEIVNKEIGLGRSGIVKRIQSGIADGTIEQVWKKGGGAKYVMAYRPKVK